MKILILGHNGMLGHMVKRYMISMGFKIETINEKWPSSSFIEYVKNSDSNFLINCIGSIPQKKPSWEQYKSVNILLPLFLSENFCGRIVHPTTDCEFSGNLKFEHFYSKNDTKDATDDYGISKSHISYLLSSKPNVKQIRTSIIGPEINSKKVSLMEWFFKQEKSLNGYINHYWNGITTLEWSKQCLNLINNWENYENVIQLGTNCINKFELLNIINRKFFMYKDIIPTNSIYSNKCLKSDFTLETIETQIIELKNFYY